MIRILFASLFFVCMVISAPQDSYQSKLNHIIDSLQQAISSSISIAQQTINSSKAFSSSDSLTLEVVTQGCNQVRKQISYSISKAAIPFNLSNQNCTAISPQAYNQLSNNFSQLLASEKQFQGQIDNIGSCPQTVEIKNLLNLLKIESSNFETQMGQLCVIEISKNQTQKNSTANSSSSTPTVYYTNIQNSASNWIYGKQNASKYNQQLDKDKLAKYAEKCPNQTPYLNKINKCISCPVLYDLSIGQCSSCPINSSLNYTIHQCTTSDGLTVIKNSNPSAVNYIGTAPFITDLSYCPVSQPYFDGTNCISCDNNSYFDYSSLLCLSCKQGMSFDINDKICKINQFKPPKLNSNIIGINYVGSAPAKDDSLQTCDSQTPYFNGVNCISCSSPLYFNFTSNTCDSCQKNYLFNASSKSCVVDASKIYYRSNIDGLSNYYGSPQQVGIEKETITASCPLDKPFSNQKYCLSCSLPNFFNFSTNQCQLCTQNLIFDVKSKSCIAKQIKVGPLKNTNIVNVTNFMFQIPVYNSSLPSCQSSKPFFNGFVCISCNLPSYFNFKSLNCENCSEEKIFNTNNRMCQYKKQKYVSDLTNPNIYFNGNYQALVNKTNQKLKSLSGTNVCPLTSPFYDATSDTCIVCPAQLPLFNIKYNKCITCGSDNHFDGAARICINNHAVNPSIERTLMNTI